jgi:hypothetical protein
MGVHPTVSNIVPSISPGFRFTTIMLQNLACVYGICASGKSCSLAYIGATSLAGSHARAVPNLGIQRQLKNPTSSV